jgi:hypothetical protein
MCKKDFSVIDIFPNKKIDWNPNNIITYNQKKAKI